MTLFWWHFFIDRLIERYFWWHFFIDRLIEQYFWWHFFRFTSPKNRFRNIPTRNRATCASGFGVTLPPPRPQKSRKKKISEKKVPKPPPRPPPLPLLIGNRQERLEKISVGDWKDRWSSGGPRNLSVTLNFLPGAGPPTRPAPCTKGQPIKSDLTAPLLTLANYLYTYIIRLLPPSSAPGYFVSVSLIGPACPGVNMIPDPNPLLRKQV